MTGGAVEFRAAIGKTDERVATPPELSGRQGHPGFATAIAVLLAAGVWGIATLAPQHLGFPALLGLGAAALVGLIFSLGMIAGFVHIGRLPRRRMFFDGLVDAVADPCVVTDSRGRVVYTNEPYRQLLAAAGQSRLIGVENLYAGYPDVADKVYRLSQAAREEQGGAGGVPACRPDRRLPWRGRTGRPGSAPEIQARQSAHRIAPRAVAPHRPDG